MARYTEQVRAVVEPTSIKGQPNGQFPDHVLHDIFDPRDGSAVGRLCVEAARSWNAMAAHAWRDGVLLLPSGPADSYRPLSVQQRIFSARYTSTDQGNGSRTCGGKRWYKRRGVASAACPGTSNHGRAIAVDVANASGSRLAWLEGHAWTYGFAWELVPEEPWHIRYCTGDAIPAAVLAYEEDDDMAMTPEERLAFAREIAAEVWGTDISVPDGSGAFDAHALLGFTFTDAHATRALVAALAAQPGPDVDEEQLAKALAPLLKASLPRLSKEDLADLRTAIGDELAQRLAS